MSLSLSVNQDIKWLSVNQDILKVVSFGKICSYGYVMSKCVLFLHIQLSERGGEGEERASEIYIYMYIYTRERGVSNSNSRWRPL